VIICPIQRNGIRRIDTVGNKEGSKLDGTLKSLFKDWIPAFAGMTSVVSG